MYDSDKIIKVFDESDLGELRDAVSKEYFKTFRDGALKVWIHNAELELEMAKNELKRRGVH